MPRAFDRGIPDADKNPLISATTWGDPGTIIGEASLNAGTTIQRFLFSLFTGCGPLVDGISEIGRVVLEDLIGGLVDAVDTALGEGDEELAASLQATLDDLNIRLNSGNPLVTLGAGIQNIVETIFNALTCQSLTGVSAQDVIDKVLELATDAGDLLGDISGTAFDALSDLVTNVWNWLSLLLTGVGGGVGKTLSDVAGLLDQFRESEFLNVLQQVTTFFGDIATGARDTFLQVLQTVVDWFGDLVDLPAFLTQLGEVVDFFLGLLNPAGFLTVLQDVIEWFGGIVNLDGFLSQLGDLVDFFLGLLNPAGFLSLMQIIVDWFGGIAEAARVPFLGILQQIVEGFGAVVNVPNFMTALRTFINGILGIVDLGNWTTTLTTIINGLLGTANLSTWVGVLKQVIDFFVAIAANVRAGFLTALQTIVETFQGLFVGGSLADWLAGIPSFAQNIIDGLWSAVSGGAAALGKTVEEALSAVGDWAASLVRDITGQDFGDIASWARDLLTKGLGWQGLFDLFGSIPAAILGVLPIPAINVVNPELMARGGFDTSATLAEGSGWSWDGTQRYPVTETTGGSAKVLGASTTRALFANQSIEVAEGDQLLIHCYVKSTGTVNSGGIRIDIVEFNGTTQGATAPIAQRNGSADWVKLGNSEAAPYVVPAGVTNIRVKLSITVAAVSGSVVWFDAISVKKTGLLDGNWMSGILGTVGQDFQTIVDSIKGAIEETATTGNPLTAVQPVIETIFQKLFGLAFLPLGISQTLLEAAIPGLDGSKITDGTVSADFLPIEDIGDELGTAITTGSGGKMSRRNTALTQAATGNSKFNSTFFQNGSGVAQVDQISADITASHSPARWTVTYAGYYIVELGFTVNANAPNSGFFNVAPAIYVNGSSTPYKVGADSLGSYGNTPFGLFGNWARSAHSTFIVYLNAGGSVDAGYVNYGATDNDFFIGDTAGNSTYFSIAMLNRTAEG